ncbi:MAG: hypothetical protein QOK07_1963, partial [Gemmatimonadaceae bacterium]|nr:hypothetical protein [Gemmatimonadaceae bacterium]
MSSEGHPQQNPPLTRAYAHINGGLYEDTAPQRTPFRLTRAEIPIKRARSYRPWSSSAMREPSYI